MCMHLNTWCGLSGGFVTLQYSGTVDEPKFRDWSERKQTNTGKLKETKEEGVTNQGWV